MLTSMWKSPIDLCSVYYTNRWNGYCCSSIPGEAHPYGEICNFALASAVKLPGYEEDIKHNKKTSTCFF